MSVDKSQDRIKRIFTEIASFYDKVNHLLSFNCDKRWREAVAKIVARNLFSGLHSPDKRVRLTSDCVMNVLDLCSGTGDQAIAVMRRLKQGSKIFCVDFTREMLLLAREKFNKMQNIGVSYNVIIGNGFRLPFSDNRFDLITISFGLRNMGDVVALTSRRPESSSGRQDADVTVDSALSEMKRVLKNGGKLCILEFSNPENQVVKLIYRFYLEKIMAKIGNVITKSKEQAYSYLLASIKEWYKAGELKELMIRCGFQNVRIYKKSLGLVAIHIGEKDEE